MKSLSAWRRNGRVRGVQGFSRATQCVAFVLLGLFCFQLSRVYLVVPADAYMCSFPSPSHESETVSGDHHHHDEAASSAPFLLANEDDGRSYFQHCKDTLDGLGLTPAQPFGLAAVMQPQPPQPTNYIASIHTPAVLDNFLPPPFQPPRLFS